MDILKILHKKLEQNNKSSYTRDEVIALMVDTIIEDSQASVFKKLVEDLKQYKEENNVKFAVPTEAQISASDVAVSYESSIVVMLWSCLSLLLEEADMTIESAAKMSGLNEGSIHSVIALAELNKTPLKTLSPDELEGFKRLFKFFETSPITKKSFASYRDAYKQQLLKKQNKD